ncbi:4-oxalocrotonate decarboxylase (EC [Amycolatopsis camponoti]|uniref:4-oxalocrotonate decarboxylase (EC) n=1 Tax=Amycolatopsis camponoti TaxID=2606593 RepID=A0A6I8LR84_9PSEU|nr:fumarylacetoacetate hydrolase family protein [Amycolatopsis camponoti]VVJ18427.1 4-oxalocrotonate decarboxylase (EC [Amycolatopsis camponoti]
MTGSTLSRYASALDEAVTSRLAIAQLSRTAALTLDDAYRVQALGSELRAARGDRLVGVKLGFTSKAKARQMGVSDVIFGRLHARGENADGGSVALADYIHPRVEPEVAFRLGARFDARASADPEAELRAAVDAVAPGLEIIDSRYADFRFSLTDVVADNTSAAGFVIGAWQPADLTATGVRFAERPVTLEIDDVVAATGSTSDILGDPVLALPAIARMAAAQGVVLPAGSVLLAGAATAAVALPGGVTVRATVAGLGTVHVTTIPAEER